MKRNIMLIVVLGLALYGVVAGLGHWASSEDDALGYSTERMVEAAYHAPARTAYTPSAAGNSAVAVPMSAGQGTPFRHTYVPAANYTVSTPMLGGGSYAAQGLMLTSQQRPQSYGGSGSATGISSSARRGMGSGSAGGSSYAMGGYASSGSSLGGTYTYSTPAGGGISVNGNMTSTFSPSVYASAPAPYASFNNDFGTWGNAYNPLDGGISAIDDQAPFDALLGGTRTRRLQQGGLYNDWIAWLNYHKGEYGTLNSDDGKYYFNDEQMQAAYEAWLSGYNTSMGGTPPSYEQWKAWFTGSGNTTIFQYRAVPIGGILPLLLMAMLSLVYIFLKQKQKGNRARA